MAGSNMGRMPLADLMRLKKAHHHGDKKKQQNKSKARGKIDRRDW